MNNIFFIFKPMFSEENLDFKLCMKNKFIQNCYINQSYLVLDNNLMVLIENLIKEH